MWVIDFPEPDETLDSWKIAKVKVLPRAVQGKKKNAKVTPIGHRRVEYDDGDGPVEYDYNDDNIDVSLARAHERRDAILRELGMVPVRVGGDRPQNIRVPFLEQRANNISNIENMWNAQNAMNENECMNR